MADPKRPGNMLDPAAGELADDGQLRPAGPAQPPRRQEPKVEVAAELREEPLVSPPVAEEPAPERTKQPAPATEQPRAIASPPYRGQTSTSSLPAGANPGVAAPARGSASGGRLAASEPDESAPAPRGRPPLWIWILGGLIALALLLLVQDLKNRERYLLACTRGGLELHQGRRFPWPFGHLPLGGLELKAIPQASGECVERTFDSELEAKEAFLETLLTRARAALAEGEESALEQVRREVQQALALAEELSHRRRDVERLLARVSYQEGKVGLQRAERALRAALTRFQEAQQLTPDRFDDLEGWITHLEEMLRALSPSPFGAPPTLSGAPPAGQQPTSRPSQPPPAAPRPSAPVTAADAGAPPPAADSSLQPGTGGILM